MRLKCIKLAGFKSFVDPTTVSFPSNLCAVVGPNGCGKSNIIDAVRWVMGESSAKHLRGESMSDVIFNGSGGRKPVGQASIELVFDNSNGSLGGSYASYNEISIKRKVTRDGQSGYFLNGNKCRRRDITDIFLGTGLGPRSYAIIEQGMISSLIEAKPDELRVYIEEAAGISKYKERRKDTESRMRRTVENLERLTDIRDELDRQIKRLERQAQAAEKYSEYKKQERRLKAELQALHWREIDEKARIQQKAITEQEIQYEARVAERNACDTALEKLRVEYTELSDSFNEKQGHFYSVGAEVARLEQSIQHAKDRAAELQGDLEQTERSYQESSEHLRADLDKLATLETEVGEISPDLEQVVVEEQRASELLQSAEESMQAWQADWDAFNQSAVKPRQQAEVEQSRIQHLEQLLARLRERADKLDEETRALNEDPARQEVALLEEQRAESERQAQENQSLLDGLVARIEKSRETLSQTNETLDTQKTALQRALGRKASLDALQQAALGSDGDVRQWLESNRLVEQQRLAEKLDVEPGWEKAVETVLGGYLQAVCVDDIAVWAEKLVALEAGEIILADANAGTVNAVDSSLGAKINGDYVPSALARVRVADNLNAALELRKELAAGDSVITPEGIWLGADWLRVARDADVTQGVLQRKQELEQLAAEIVGLEQQIDKASEEKAAAESSLKSLELERSELAEQQQQQQQQYTALCSKLSAAQAQIEQVSTLRTRLQGEIEEVLQQQQQEQQHLADARKNLEQAIEMMERDTVKREQLLQSRDEYRVSLDSVRQDARHKRDRKHELAMREKSVSTQLLSLKEGIARLDTQVERLAARRTQLLDTVKDEQNPSDELQIKLEQQLERRLQAEHALAEARKQVDAVEQRMRETEQSRAKVESDLQQQRSALEQQRLVAQEQQTRAKTIVEQIDESDFELQALLESLGDDAALEEWERALEKMAARIQRLGPINLAAIEEFKVESERKTYLDAQNDELVDALETLREAIRKIDKETRTRFKETFDKMNKSLQELFPRLFGGGHAYLELTGDDLLDTGVAIMARPPGKKNSTIHLLSGGEKAMTAIALVFSIFQLNPAPFCMLDEVDAPLDDTNVGRYSRMVHEMSEKLQFIYITHNKIAMEMSHQLMGVTMNEPGVSRLVSVDVDQAVELADA